MTKQILLFTVLTLTISKLDAQSPSLSLVGGSPSFAKGTIDTEVLTEIIQQKQEEVKQRVFRNTIVKQFNYGNDTINLKNFTTYYYMYNLMDVMTTGKNKTSITKSLIESSSEFSYVFGAALYAKSNVNNRSASTFLFDINSADLAKVELKDNRVTLSENVKEFNLLIDLCYDIIINDKSLQKTFKFKKDLSDADFSVWYKNDNVFYLDSIKSKGVERDQLIEQRKKVAKQLKDFSDLVDQVTNNINTINTFLTSLKTANNQSLKTKIDELLDSLTTLDSAELNARILKIKDKFSFLSQSQKDSLVLMAGLITNNYDNYKGLFNFYSGLQKSNFKDFSLTKNQYYAMKFMLIKFLDIAKNQYPSDAIASIIDFLLENTIIKYADNSGNIIDESSLTKAGQGYLYVDIESLISTIDQKFSSSRQSGLRVYIQPFFSIGTNYAYFISSNSLTSEPNGISNLYFASEKIGIRWKLWNWKYTHSFEPGQSFRYTNQLNLLNPWHWHGKKWINKKGTTLQRQFNPSRYWLRPQPKTLLNDVHVILYGSGLLYNIANLKSDENFNYAVVGTGLGVTFFNGLSANVSVACPLTDKKFNSDNMFLNFGFDIPIVEYIAGLGKKK